MQRCPNLRRLGIAFALALPALVIFVGGGLEAQQKFNPPPVMQPPQFKQPPIMQPPQFKQPPIMQPPQFKQPPIMQPPQFKPPPPIQMPQMQSVWKCSRCNAVMGTGAFPPATCPSCGARIMNGIGGGNPVVNNNPPQRQPEKKAGGDKLVIGPVGNDANRGRGSTSSRR